MNQFIIVSIYICYKKSHRLNVRDDSSYNVINTTKMKELVKMNHCIIVSTYLKNSDKKIAISNLILWVKKKFVKKFLFIHSADHKKISHLKYFCF